MPAANHTANDVAYARAVMAPEVPTEPFASAPVDPRAGWGLAPLGTLPTIEEIEPLAVRVIAPNAGPMTLDGTNTYVVGAPGGDALVVDPGPHDARHFERVHGVLAARDQQVAAIFVTHRHLDHAAAAAAWADALGVTVFAGAPPAASPAVRQMADGDVLSLAGCGPLLVVATPGHLDDHLALRLPSGALLVGDHILGRGTSVISRNGGNLTDYLASLRKVLDLGPESLLPGHGPHLADDPQAVIDYYLAHREHRLRQICHELRDEALPVGRLVQRCYPALDDHLSPAATQSVVAALEHLERIGAVRIDRTETVTTGASVARLRL